MLVVSRKHPYIEYNSRHVGSIGTQHMAFKTPPV